MQIETGDPAESATRPDSPLRAATIDLLGATPTLDAAVSTTLVPDGDGGVNVVTTTDAGMVVYVLTVPEGSGVDRAADGTVAVLGPDGALLAGLAEPLATAPDGSLLRMRWSEAPAGPGQLALVLETGSPDEAPAGLTVDVHVGREVVAAAEWGDREGGESLALTPTAWGRVSGTTGRTYGWAGVVALEPSADTQVMKYQFLCHLDGAREKATWNLEPWRPAVSYLDYLLARCNPT